MDGSEIWDHINDSVSAGAWPLVVLICAIVIVFAFREQVGDRIRSIREANVAGATVKMDASREANEVLGQTVPEVLGRPEPKAITAGPDQRADADGEPKTVTGSAHLEAYGTIIAEADVARAGGTVSKADVESSAEPDDLLERRDQIEEIIRASWRAGYEAGHSSESAEPPEPNIDWTGSKPSIVGWNAVVRPKSITATVVVPGTKISLGRVDPSDAVRRLEDEIRRLRAKGVTTSKGVATHDYLLYIELRDKLRRLDPNSPFA
jgi:hypothetical protein